MKILAITNLYPPHFLGGYELICWAVLNNLRGRGHDISVLTSNHRVPGVTEGDSDFQVSRSLRLHGFYGHPWLPIHKLIKLERENNEVLRKALEHQKPDLVYVWNMGGLSKSMLITLQRLNIPMVVYMSDHWIARGITSDVWVRWWNRSDAPLHQRVLRRACEVAGLRKKWDRQAPTSAPEEFAFRRIYFCSKALRKLTASAGFEVMHGAVIYCPVNVQRFNAPVKPVDQPVRNFLYLGRLAEDKGVLTALKAIAAIKDKFQGTLTVHGRGDAAYEAHLKAFVSTHGLPVRFSHGKPAESPAVYQRHDALLFTSEWAEPFALTPLEAMASGLPVIGTTTGGSKELFRHGENALTYAAGNSDELAERILELQNNNKLRYQIASHGQEEVRQNYAEDIIVDQIETYLKESLPSQL